MVNGIGKLGRILGIKPTTGADSVSRVSKKNSTKIKDEIEIKPEHLEAAKRMEEVRNFTGMLLSQEEEVDPDTVKKYRELLEKGDFLSQDKAARIAQELVKFLSGD